MIGPGDIRKKAERRYPDFLSSIVSGESFFPLIVPFAKVRSGEAAARWNELGPELARLRRGSDEVAPGTSYRVEWEERRDRLAGNQLVPSEISFPDERAFLAFIGKSREAERFRADLSRVLGAFPALRPWAEAKPLAIVERSGEWPRILAALAWLEANPDSGLYVREIPAVEDTKFIEARKGFLRELLDLVSPRAEAGGVGGAESFEERCGLATPQRLVRLRVLDRRVADTRLAGLDDISVPIDQLSRLDFPEIERVLVIENKTTFGRADVFLTAPELHGTIAIFGSGYASRALGPARWMETRRIGYWGDIDSYGLRILSGFRAAFPAAESILMDEETFDRFPEYRSDAPEDEAAEPEDLGLEEMSLFRRLVALPTANRLEQERIPLGYARERLKDWARALSSAAPARQYPVDNEGTTRG